MRNPDDPRLRGHREKTRNEKEANGGSSPKQKKEITNERKKKGQTRTRKRNETIIT